MQRVLLWAFLAAALTVSLLTATQRFRVERRNRAVELIADYSEIAQLAIASGRSTIEALKTLKSAGVTTVAISELTIGDLMAQGRVFVRYPQGRLEQTVLLVDGNLVSQLADQLRRVLGGEKIRVSEIATDRSTMEKAEITIRGRVATDWLQSLPAGLPTQAIADARAAGLLIVARLINYPGATPKAIREILSNLQKNGVRKIVFQGDQVLGFKGAVKDTARYLKRFDLIFGRIEFAKQKGEIELAKHVEGNIIPVHSITQNEMPTLSRPDIVERYRKAVRERGVRLCYIRMYESAGSDVISANAVHVHEIAATIQKDGYVLASSHTLTEVRIPKWQRAVPAVGVAAGALLLVTSVIDISAGAFAVWLITGTVAFLLLAWTGDFGRKIIALAAALIFPTVGAIYAVRSLCAYTVTSKKTISGALGRLATAALMSTAGGILVVGLLSSKAFMLRVDQFAGIKAAHLIPILLVAACFAGGIAWQCDSWAVQRKRLIESYQKLLSNPVLMWQALGLLLALIIIGLMIARSGNEAGIGVSPIELKFRAILDKVLGVRPRTKEFLVGYPLLFVGIACALHGRRREAAVLVTIGSIGLVSVVNTFCHIHTPLVLSSLRTINGFVVGAVIGIVLWCVLKKLLLLLEVPPNNTDPKSTDYR